MSPVERNPTREVQIGDLKIGADNPIAVQSMAATPTLDVERTISQVQLLEKAGADIVRIAIDNKKEAEALEKIREQTTVPLSVDLQEYYRLAELVAPFVDKIRYNPGHLWHHERGKPAAEKVARIVEVAAQNDCAIRIGVNCGSVDPDIAGQFDSSDAISPIVESALQHTEILDNLGFQNFCVSLKDSNPSNVMEAYRRFAKQRPDIPLHLGVTEAGLPPGGIMKTQLAFERLIPQGIGDTIRVSLTLPFERKGEEIEAGRQILSDIEAGRFLTQGQFREGGLNIIACPSCSRVQNEVFVELAQWVEEKTQYAKEHDVIVAIMGCRVNGKGETDHADLGVWCGKKIVNLKRGTELIGQYSYDEIRPRILEEVERLIEAK